MEGVVLQVPQISVVMMIFTTNLEKKLISSVMRPGLEGLMGPGITREMGPGRVGGDLRARSLDDPGWSTRVPVAV